VPPAPLLELGLEHVSTGGHRLVAHRVLQAAERRVVPVVELLDELEGPPARHHVQPDQLLGDPVGEVVATLSAQAGHHLVEPGVGAAEELVDV
jgi:hypothetical protein